MKNRERTKEKQGGATMKIEEARALSLEEFTELDNAYGGFDRESTKNHPLRDENESFMEFVKKGSEKIKSDPIIKKILE